MCTCVCVGGVHIHVMHCHVAAVCSHVTVTGHAVRSIHCVPRDQVCRLHIVYFLHTMHKISCGTLRRTYDQAHKSIFSTTRNDIIATCTITQMGVLYCLGNQDMPILKALCHALVDLHMLPE